MASIISALIIVFLAASSLHAYRVLKSDYQSDQSDVYQTGIENPDEILIVTEELKEPSLLEKIQKKIDELEGANKKLQQDFNNAQNELNRRTNEYKRKNVAKVQLETKHQNQTQAEADSDGFWNWICRISKSLLGGFLNLFGMKIWNNPERITNFSAHRRARRYCRY